MRRHLLKNGFLSLNPIVDIMTVFTTAPLVKGIGQHGDTHTHIIGGRSVCLPTIMRML
jgi:hypothetical protein